MKTIKKILSTMLLLSMCVMFSACPDDPEPAPVSDNILGTWHGWMNSYRDNPQEGRQWKWDEMGYLTFKDDNTCEFIWYDGDDFEPSYWMNYRWAKSGNKYLLTFINGHDEDGDDAGFGDLEAKLINSNTMDLGLWIGDEDENHETLTKGDFDLGIYRDLSKRIVYETTWHGELGGYKCNLELDTFAELDVYASEYNGKEYISAYLHYNYTQVDNRYVLTKEYASQDYLGYDNLEVKYVNAALIQVRIQGRDSWMNFQPGKWE